MVTASHWLSETLPWLLGAGAIFTILFWGLVWYGVEKSMRVVPTLRLGQKLASVEPPSGSVCVVVPAHNETRVIAGLVRSLRAEIYPQLRVVLALDRCTDDTAAIVGAEIAGDERFEVVEIDSCPSDWNGKVHAVHEGVTRSRAAGSAEFLLFSDADTLFSPGCITSSLALMRHRRLDMLSLLSTLTYNTWFTRTVQTAAAFELMRAFPLVRVNNHEKKYAFANGQFMLFTREAYDAIGGHSAVRNALGEDFAFARLMHARKRSVGVFLAAGLLHCSMYGEWPQFRSGWKRIYTEAAGSKARRLLLWSRRTRWLGSFLPLWLLACGVYGAFTYASDAPTAVRMLALWLFATLFWLGVLTRITVLSRAPAWTAPLHPVGAWLTANLLAEASDDVRLHRSVSWGGREYELGADRSKASSPGVHGEVGRAN
jgi:cellulose synthase/poly-beta-1,6-N-acetylglucosamine synthase-like glycosyltransferase